MKYIPESYRKSGEVVCFDKVVCRIIYDYRWPTYYVMDFPKIDRDKHYINFREAFEEVLRHLPKDEREVAYVRDLSV